MDLSLLTALDLRFVIISALLLMAFAGLLIVLSPQHFALSSRSRSRSLDARNFFGSLDRQYSVDKRALWHSRLFGLALLVSAAALAWVYWTKVLDSAWPL